MQAMQERVVTEQKFDASIMRFINCSWNRRYTKGYVDSELARRAEIFVVDCDQLELGLK